MLNAPLLSAPVIRSHDRKDAINTFGSLVIAGHGLPPVTAGIGVWLDGVGQAGMYGRAERMNGRTRLHRCREGIPINNGTRIEGVLVRIGSREQDTECVAIS